MFALRDQFCHLLLLADRNVFRDMGSGFRTKRATFQYSDLIAWIIVAALLIAALAFLAGGCPPRETNIQQSAGPVSRAL